MAETAVDTETPKMKPRPIMRLGIFLISHSLIVSVVCCTAAVLALLLLPVLAKNTYISENALMPGSASSMLSNHDISEANRLVKDLSSLNPGSEDSGVEIRRLLARYMSDLGAEVSYHKFLPQPSQFRPLHFFSSSNSGTLGENISCSSYGVNTIGIVRAPRGDGKEAIVLVTPYNFGKSDVSETLSLSTAYSVFSLLTRVTWLAKDIIWLVADSRYGEYASVASWLRDYHSPSFCGLASFNDDLCENLYVLKENSAPQRKLSYDFRRAGTMAAALVVKVTDRNELWDDTLHIYAEASNGQMPNLDLINIVNYLAVHRQGFHVKVKKFWSLVDLKWLETLGNTFESLGKVARSINPDWKFGIPAADYVEGAATLASSLYYQALGIPTGSHGAFRDFQVDAITMEISPKVSFNKRTRHNEFILQGGRLIEGVIRSVNNLLEKFHQSFFLYILTSPNKFVSVGVYMIAFAILVAPLPLVAASLYADANKSDLGIKTGQSAPSGSTGSYDTDISFKTRRWVKASKEVFLVHAWGLVHWLLPYYICQLRDLSPTTSLIIWAFLSTLILLILYLVLGYQYSPASQCQSGDWAMLKSVTISAVFIGLLLMSVVNFATAEIGAMLIVPTCLLARPLKLDIGAASLRSFLTVICNLVLVFIAFPPVPFFALKVIFEGTDSICIGDFWNWVESLWAWNSATYIYIGMVHLPCWVLCLRILLHSC